MSNGSPTAYLLWAILSCIFLAFLCLHLWAYDRFKCLKWDAGRQPGAFKRVMTYSYVATLPLLVLFSVSMTSIKFMEGYVVTPTGQIIPRPFSLWQPHNRAWLLPLYFLLSIGWSLELVTHLEELAFWLFLLHQGPGKRAWFHSWEFRTWYLGSMAAILGMPLTTLVARRDLETCQVWIFLVGSSAGTSTTLCFLYVLARFPQFIEHVKAEGAEPNVVVRLATFYQLNRVRVLFRFLFTVPLLIIALDGIKAPYPIVGHPFALDFLLMMGGIGCFISSAITLLIFFPRSITQESGYKARVESQQMSGKPPTVSSPLPDYYQHVRNPSSMKSTYRRHPVSPDSTLRMSAFQFPQQLGHPFHGHDRQSHPGRRRRSGDSDISPGYESDTEGVMMPSVVPFQLTPSSRSQTVMSMKPASGGRSDDTMWEHQAQATATRRHSAGSFAMLAKPTHSDAAVSASQEDLRRRPGVSNQLHPYVMTFTSPIDLLDLPDVGHPHHV